MAPLEKTQIDRTNMPMFRAKYAASDAIVITTNGFPTILTTGMLTTLSLRNR